MMIFSAIVSAQPAADWTQSQVVPEISSPRVSPDGNGGVVVAARAARRLALVRYAASGEAIWSRTLAEWNLDAVAAPLVLSDGSIVVAATSAIHDPTIPITPVRSGVVLISLASDGGTRWSRELAAAGTNHGLGQVAMDPEGNVILAATVHPVDDEPPFVLVVKCSADGEPRWERRVYGPAGTGGVQCSGLAVSPDGTITLADSAFGVVSRVALQRLTRFSAQGEELWSVTEEADSSDAGWTITLTPEGGVFIAGRDRDGLVLRTYSADGELSGFAYRPSSRLTTPRGLAVASGGTLISVSHEYRIRCFDEDECVSYSNALLIAHDPEFNELWSVREYVDFWPVSLGLDEAGNIFLVSLEAQVSKFAPNGTRLWRAALLPGASASGAVDGDGRFFFAAVEGPTLRTARFSGTAAGLTPAVAVLPASVTTNAGATITLEALVTGTTPLRHEWFHYLPLTDRVRIVGTDARLILTNVSRDLSGFYTVRVEDESGVLASTECQVTVVAPPVFSGDRSRTNLVRLGAAAVVALEGANMDLGDARLQWARDGIPVEGATNRSIVIDAFAEADAGTYTLVASNLAGTATSAPIHLVAVPNGPLDHAEWLHPAPQGNDIRGGAHGNGRHVLRANRGTILVSTNSRDWTARQHEFMGEIRDIAFGGGRFALATSRGIFLSEDGISWTRTGPEAREIVHGSEGFLAITESGQSTTSADGTEWMLHKAQLAGELTFGNGLYVARLPSFHSGVGVSTNGLEWHGRATPVDFSRIRFGNGVFVGLAGWQVFTSTDAENWTAGPIYDDRRFGDIAAGPKGFVAVGEDPREIADADRTRVYHSEDGLNWSVSSFRSGNNFEFAVAGGDGFVVGGDDGNLAISADGENWEEIVRSSDLNLRGIARGTPGYVAVGQDGTILFSEDGAKFSPVPFSSEETFRSVAFGHGRFVMTGASALFVSEDGRSWHVIEGDTRADQVVFADGRFVGVGVDGGIVTSANGRDWEFRPVPGIVLLREAAYGSGRWVALEGTAILASTDLREWTRVLELRSESVMKLCYGGDRFLAISGSGTNWVSMDGLSWRAISRFPGGAVDALTFGAGMFVASDPSGRLYSSKDGVLWVENNSITQNRVRALAFIDGAFFAVGNNHSIFRSGQYLPRLNIGRRMGGDVEVEIGSDPAVPAVVEFSEDLVNWEALSSPPAGVDGTKAVYSENASSPRRFFRVRQ